MINLLVREEAFVHACSVRVGINLIFHRGLAKVNAYGSIVSDLATWEEKVARSNDKRC